MQKQSQFLKNKPRVFTLLIISELKGSLILLQQHPCLWPYNSKAHYTSALTINSEATTVKIRLSGMCDSLHMGSGAVSRTNLNDYKLSSLLCLPLRGGSRSSTVIIP